MRLSAPRMLPFASLVFSWLPFAPPAPAQAPPPLPEPGVLNRYVLDVLREYPRDGTCTYYWPKGGGWEGTTKDLFYLDKKIASGDPQRRSYCCGLTYEVFLVAWERWCRDAGVPFRVGMLDAEGIVRLRRRWFGDEKDDRRRLVQHALTAEGIGVAIQEPDDAAAGDFVQFWRQSGSGHSAIFIDWVRDPSGARIGFTYWSSQGSTNGINFNTEFFGGEKGVLPEEVYIGRAGRPGAWVFPYFRDDRSAFPTPGVELDGRGGLRFAYSRDGWRWSDVKGGASFLKPTAGSGIFRDPSLLQGPDGVFHLVWTAGRKGFGYSSSRDLKTWSPQKYVEINADVPGLRNTWAPELFYDRKKGHFLVLWSSTIDGKFPDAGADNGLNHRIYGAGTKDFETFGPPRLFYDPGFNCIDAYLVEAGDRYLMFLKDERPDRKHLLVTTAPDVDGPWAPVAEALTPPGTEAPSVLRIGGEWILYYDHYAVPNYYGAVRTNDLKTWEDVTEKMRFPRGMRHGGPVWVEEGILKGLLD